MLKYILGDMSFEEFRNGYFEKAPLLIRNGSKLGELFSITDFDQYLISCEGSLQDRVRVVKDKASISIPSHSGASETQREFVLNQFKAGATLKLEDLDSRHTAMSSFCKGLEELFGGYCFAKPFLTGAGFKGLDVHFDTTEVFVIQLEGKKAWRVWRKQVHNPTSAMQTKLDESTLGELEIETVLEGGDILYIPAGTPHRAECADDYSLHMAVGLAPVRLFEVIEGYIRLLSEHVPELRTNVFPFSNSSTLEDHAKLNLMKLHDTDFSQMLKDFHVAYSAVKHETCNARLFSLARGEKMGVDTKLKLRAGSDIAIRELDSVVSVYFSSTISPGKDLISTPTALQLPAFCKEAITFVKETSGNAFSPFMLPDVLDAESKVLLCKELIGVGIVVLA